MMKEKVAIVTGASRGIGRSIALALAGEGAKEVASARNAAELDKLVAEIRERGEEAVAVPGDVAATADADRLVEEAVAAYGRLDILVNNAGEQHESEDVTDISEDQLLRTFRTNFFGTFFMTQAALKQMHDGASIINCTSVTAYRGSKHLVDYASTKGAMVSFTRSLSTQLANKGIRVNAVAPGPIWTPLIPASFNAEDVGSFGQSVPLGRPGQPDEVAPCFVFLASSDSSYMTGQVLHPNGGEIINA